jgi:capsular exopolysaccharide synthesis family protein
MIQTKAQIAELDKEIAAQSDTIKGSLKTAYDTALGREAALMAQVNGLKGTLLDQDKRSIQYNILQRDVDTNRTLYDGLLQRYKEIGVAGGIGTNNISVVDKANLPGSPFKPKPLHNIALAAAIGLALGLLAAFGLEVMDESVRSPEDVETKMAVPMLGSIPLLGTLTPLDALKDRRSIVSEAYYSARTALQFSTSDGVPRSLVVTSSRPGEGKTTTAMALAMNFARLGLRVLLIDSDLRHPSLHRLLDRPVDRGLTLFLTNSVGLDEIIQTTDYKNLFLTTSGPVPPNPAELLAGPRFAALLAEAESKFDLVVMDSAPVMGLADAPLIASVAAGTVFVIEAGWTRTGLAKIALGRLRAANARIIGCLLTKFNAKKAGYGYGYGDGYGYGYGDEAYGYGAVAEPLEPLEPPAVDAA